jgi:hypothetical protein
MIGKGYSYLNSTRKQVQRVVRGQESLNLEAMSLEQYTVDSLNNQGLNLNDDTDNNKRRNYWSDKINDKKSPKNN